jgi:Ca2+-binding RTX toxin-like protein
MYAVLAVNQRLTPLRFFAKIKLKSTDTITDFVAADDTFSLSNAIFSQFTILGAQRGQLQGQHQRTSP